MSPMLSYCGLTRKMDRAGFCYKDLMGSRSAQRWAFCKTPVSMRSLCDSSAKCMDHCRYD